MKSLLVVIFLLFSTDLIADVVFYDDCENTPNYGVEWNKNGDTAGNTFTVSAEQALAGTNSYKFHIVHCTSNGVCPAPTNVELILRGTKSVIPVKNFTLGQKYWVGVAVYFPATTDLSAYPNNLGLSMQWHAANDSCDYVPILQPLSFGNLNAAETSGAWTITQAYNTPACSTSAYQGKVDTQGPFNKGSWNYVVMELIFNYQNTALTHIWINGTEVVNNSTYNAKNDTVAPYFKMGIYGQFVNDVDVYFDEFRVGDENSSYNEVVPPTPANPPVLSGGYPTGTLDSGTTSTTWGFTSNKDATCRWSANAADDWAAMGAGNEMSTTGAMAHSNSATGLTDGNTYYRYALCQDSGANESDKITVSFAIGQAGGGSTNLINASTITSFTGSKPEAIYDGCVDDYGPCMPEQDGNSATLEIDLGAAYSSLVRRFHGDAVGTRVSKTLTIDWKLNSGDSWTNFETDTNVYGSQWYDADMTGITARYIRQIVGTDTGIVQWRESGFYGVVTPTPPSTPGLKPRAGKPPGSNVMRAGKR